MDNEFFVKQRVIYTVVSGQIIVDTAEAALESMVELVLRETTEAKCRLSLHNLEDWTTNKV